MKKYILEIIVFICGAVVMILELVGSRVLAPYVGTSIFVWSSLIGIVLGSLSYGYWQGGKIADKNPKYKTLSLIIFSGAFFTGLVTFLKSPVLIFLKNSIADIRITAIVATSVLFMPPSVFLGMVSPYAVKLKMKDIKSSGRTVGNLYAISTIGSISGTFLAGFFLISYFGNAKILLFLSIILALTSFLAYFKNIFLAKSTVILFLILCFLSEDFFSTFYQRKKYVDVDTQYGRYIVLKNVDKKLHRPVQLLVSGPDEVQSGIFLDGDKDLVFEYAKYYRLAKHFSPGLKNSLMIGGGAYTYPRDYLEKFPDARIDVVEIDPKLTEVAKKYFGFQDNPKMTIYHEDGRTFLNSTENKYDMVFIDAFRNSYSIPYQLTTKEAVEDVYRVLNENGAVLVNMISSIEGEKGKFLRAECLTYKSVFPQVYVFPVDYSSDGLIKQNVMLVALKSEKRPLFESKDSELNEYLSHLWQDEIKTDVPILTDDYAPVDNYALKLI